jgi:glycerophosphoryl diester phosphodiesterase
VSERSFSQARPIVVAHRGAPLIEPENTIPSFEAAVAAGADAVEFDVRLSADGRPVILHDAAVDRTTDGHGLARDLTVAELERIAIPRGDGDPTTVPTLEETLATLSGRIGVDIELKQLPGEPDFDPDVDRLVEATLRTIDVVDFVGPVLLSSFNPFALDAARRRAPDVPLGLLTDPSVEVAVALGFASEHAYDWLLPPVPRVVEAGERIVARAHDAGLRIGTWNTEDPEEARMLMGWGLDAIATNDPAAIVAARAGWDA